MDHASPWNLVVKYSNMLYWSSETTIMWLKTWGETNADKTFMYMKLSSQEEAVITLIRTCLNYWAGYHTWSCNYSVHCLKNILYGSISSWWKPKKSHIKKYLNPIIINSQSFQGVSWLTKTTTVLGNETIKTNVVTKTQAVNSVKQSHHCVLPKTIEWIHIINYITVGDTIWYALKLNKM